MNEVLLEEWTENVYKKRPGALFQQPNILIMDSATSHKKETVNAKARRCQVTCVKIMSEAACPYILSQQNKCRVFRSDLLSLRAQNY